MKEVVGQIIAFLGREATVMSVATLPFIELRGAIPVGISLGLHPVHAYILALLGSMVPSPLILLTFRPLFNSVKRTGSFKKLMDRIVDRTMKRSGKIKKYYALGLFLFVAVPLPSTGVWTGSLAASLLNIRLLHALPAIFLGNAVAGLIILLISYGVLN
ncbi:MAG: hypothetical protein HPY66_1520 [Firmicutes bacterium]|nr:hypothetical protein [Bacillota bacterium]MDI6707439.1 small multi-drug export protein [Bacillota bacterium]